MGKMITFNARTKEFSIRPYAAYKCASKVHPVIALGPADQLGLEIGAESYVSWQTGDCRALDNRES